ncbi:DNA adenine methylase [Providencia huaxiensis]|uniref:site-specific DNA-methyltransferase (adenine-specific) n=1 Tax=Providencia huaxiensis TaxID=2027290 RepID=A0A8I2DBG3_9GAMM|nr:Dam family site-specific DNA-(adenine-N6)-methyltransferase [Providencia huaxiensis]MBQ0269561.1 Dam family site-specific DNA-(adenine-N6)-methyltransferase [Providencia huaxiensis]
MANKTILKWAGSKVRIIEQLRPYLPKTKRLVEPFAGSCAVMMNTDYERYLVADANPDLISLYQCIADPIEGVFETLNFRWDRLNNSETYYSIRNSFNNKSNVCKYNLATYFLVLNRHGYNGLCRYNKKGEFNVPFGKYAKPYYPKNEITAFEDKAARADIVCLEWQDTLSLIDINDGVYCDPPYMGDNFTRYCANDFTNSDHESLAFALKDINDMQGNPITVSNSLEAKELYADLGFIIHEIEAPRTIAANGNRKPAKEIIAVLNGDAQ